MPMRLWTLIGLLAVCMTMPALAAERLSPHFNRDTMMLSSEVERGMRAVGKTVFAGTTITEFNLEILSVLENSNSGMDLVIAKVLDGPVVERESGIIGGMSGSPVYINGKLVGAIAYGWQWVREPICGITTINSMLNALDKPAEEMVGQLAPERKPEYALVREPFSAAGREITGVRIAPPGHEGEAFADAHTMVLAPVTAPVYCAGLPPKALEHLNGVLKPYGMEAIAGPGKSRYTVPVKIEPGAALGSSLVSGDIDISTGGTVTYVDGDLILGFGHPYMEFGKVAFPLTTSWVHDFVPRYSRTDKMMSVMEDVGTITQDRNWAIGGILGPTAPKVPATITITDRSREITDTYRVEIMRQRVMTPQLMGTSVLTAILNSYNSQGEGMVKVRFRVKGEKGHEITREDIFYHDGMLSMPAISGMMAASYMLTDNRFRPQDVTGLEYSAELWDADDTAAVESVTVDEPVAKAGEDITVRVRLRPDDGDIIEKAIKLHMPVSLAKGRIRIGVSGGDSAMAVRSRVGILPPTFYNLESAIEQIETLERGDQLFVAAGLPTRDISVEGTRLFRLPEMLKSALMNSPRTDLAAGGAEVSKTLDMPWRVYGGAIVTLPTEDREGKVGKAPSPSPSSSEDEDETLAPPPAPDGVPASLWWAASAFEKPRSGATRRAASRVTPSLELNGGEEEDDEALDDEDDEDAEAADEENGDEDEGADEGKKGDKEKPDTEGTQPKDKKKGDVGRKPSVWEQTSAEDFSAGELEGLAVRSDGRVEIAPNWKKTGEPEEMLVWCLAAGTDKGYAGTIKPGRVYALENGDKSLLADTGEFGVSALCIGSDGAVIAATFPGGKVLAIRDGKTETLCTLEDLYVWALVGDGFDGYYAAVGPGAAVYHISAQGDTSRIATLPQEHATRLLLKGEDLYVGTADRGGLYRLNAKRELTALYDSGTDEVTGIELTADGSVVFSTAPTGRVISVAENGDITELFKADSGGVISLAAVNGVVYAALDEDGRVVRIVDRDIQSLARRDEGRPCTALAARGSRLFLATTSPVQLYTADLQAACEGSLESGILDAKRPSRWGRADWRASLPEGTRMELRMRSGNTSDPEYGGWSPWCFALEKPGRDLAGPPTARYLQYKLTLAKGEDTKDPWLDWLRVRYLPENQRPKVKDPTPKEGAAISDKFTLKWKMEDADKDELEARIEARKHGEEAWKTVKDGVTKSEFEWNTKDFADGVYDLRITASDRRANPTGSLEHTLDILNVTIDNTAPEIELISGPAEQKDGEFALTGFALDALCMITNIAWRPAGKDDEDNWRGAWLDDGLYDWTYERFLVDTGKLADSVTEIIIRARDAAGNVTDKTVKLPERRAKLNKPEEKKDDKPKDDKPKDEKGETANAAKG